MTVEIISNKVRKAEQRDKYHHAEGRRLPRSVRPPKGSTQRA
jgi:hypothetical protein